MPGVERVCCLGAGARPDDYSEAMVYEGQPVGNISIELGCGPGIVSEAADAVIDFFFEQSGIHRLNIRRGVRNPASERVAQKCVSALRGDKARLEVIGKR